MMIVCLRKIKIANDESEPTLNNRGYFIRNKITFLHESHGNV